MSSKTPRMPRDKGIPAFTPARPRRRHDGWTVEKQLAFIEALAETACVSEACERVGMAPSSAYALRRHADAASFRQAWDIALDYAVRNLSDAAFSRAVHGIARPVFYKGEQIGERRYYNDRLTMFLLRYRDPVRYGAWMDKIQCQRHPDGAALTLAEASLRVAEDAIAVEAGLPRPEHEPIVTHRTPEGDEEREEREERERAAFYARQAAEDENERYGA